MIADINETEILTNTKKDNDLDIKILNIIESNIINRKCDILSLIRIIKKGLLEITNKTTILNSIRYNLSNTKYYFLRHAISEHNIKKHQNILNPNLTLEGQIQTAEVINKYKNILSLINYVFISPLRRTLTTFELIFSGLTNTNKQIFSTDLIREILSKKDTNIGLKLDELKESYNNSNIKIDFSYINKSNWWIDNDWNNILNEGNTHEPEDSQSFHLRLKLFLLWITFKCKGNVLIVSHSKVYHYLALNKKISCSAIKLLEPEEIFILIKKIFDDDILI